MRFRDRVDAGRALAELLLHLRGEDVVVLGLPRGGVPVAAEVARALVAPLDVVVVRKLGLPWQPELAVGAVGEGGVLVRNPELLERTGLADDRFAEVVVRERAEVERRAVRLRHGRPACPLAGRTAVLVDDGLATGATARAALEVLRASGTRRTVLAVPVAPAEAVEALHGCADEVVTALTPRPFRAVGQAYLDFSATPEDEVVRLLHASSGAVAGRSSDRPDAPAP